ncbi:MAG: right-handed parallel beta-helix repeat-containing protein [Deltaproteobacteria bacterium]|nr:right-handed parallel beta-helix repeat-containing protein [Deltaproteobacteria bacterium]
MMTPCAAHRRLVITFAATVLTMMSTFSVQCSSPLAAIVTLSPEDSIQNSVNANPPGTTFLLRPGIYRDNSVVSLKDGDSFIGRPGAIMNGAKLLTGWSKVSIHGVDYWTTAGGTPRPLVTPGCGSKCCLAGYPGCTYVQDLYVDNIDYRHVTTLADTASRTTWYYDFGGTDGGIRNNIYLAADDDPNFHRVELGDSAYAFRGTASNITISNLIIEKYAAPISSAAVQVEGPHWLIQHNEVRLNHGTGITAKRGGNKVRVLGNRLHHNGQFGMGGPANDGLWDSNYVAYNNIDGVNPDFGAGGSKFAGNNITISNNIVHGNYGPGLWTDDGGTYDRYEHNISYNNFAGGIRYEISRYGVITNNTVYGNTKNAQIVYTGSDHGRISGNRVIDNGSGAIVVVNIVGTRPRSSEPIYKVIDTQVTSNMIETSCNPNEVAVGLIDHAQPPQPTIFSDTTNLFDRNIYRFSNSFQFTSGRPARRCWAWGETGPVQKPISWSAWQGSRQDPNGAVITPSTSR